MLQSEIFSDQGGAAGNGCSKDTIEGGLMKIP
jgi:hypothetical protein